MLFYEPLFLFFYMPALYALYVAINRRPIVKKCTLLIASVAFYAWGEPLFVPVLLGSVALDYQIARRLVGTKSNAWRERLVACGVVANLILLSFYKYADFFLTNLNVAFGPLTGRTIPLLHIALPIGISFVVFEKITYLVDVYRGTSPPAKSFVDYCLFVFFFPKLLAGPILKYHEMAGQFSSPRAIGWPDFHDGLLRFARGIAKKLLIADPLGRFADLAFATDPAALGSSSAWLALLCFTLQIYFDFSGYSDMAIGLARMLGFQLRENFRMPYVARSLTEFWRRWHISFTTFIRDYLYVPLGGNRYGSVLTYRNLWICFLISGLWHGASWNFVLWGAYNGLFLTLDRMFLVKILDRTGKFMATIFTFAIVMLGWMIFRSPSVMHLGAYLHALANLAEPGTLAAPNETAFALAVGLLLSFLPATPLYARLQRAYEGRPLVQHAATVGLIMLYVASCARALAIPFKPFIYFRF